MISARSLVVVVAVWLTAFGACGKSDDGEAKPAASAGADVATDKTSKRTKKPKKDRGEASMKLGDITWTAERAKARLKGAHLRIEASSMDMSGKKVSRQQLSLILPDYKGAGSYEARPGSMFVGVGLDKAAAHKAVTDEKAGKLATEAVTKAKTVMFMKTTVVVTSANDKDVVGTFSQPAMGRQPEINGTFRAVLKR